MPPHQFQVLTPEQRQHFIERGYVTAKGCLDFGLATPRDEQWKIVG